MDAQRHHANITAQNLPDEEHWPCRFRRLAGGEDRLSLATLYEQPDLAGNAFVHRIFRLFDTNQNGFLTWEDFSAGIHQICGLQTEDDQSLCKSPATAPLSIMIQVLPHCSTCVNSDQSFTLLHTAECSAEYIAVDMIPVILSCARQAVSSACSTLQLQRNNRLLPSPMRVSSPCQVKHT